MVIRNDKERFCNDCMQFKRKREVNCFHIAAEVGFGHKGELIFYNTPETTVKGKVKSYKKQSKKQDDDAATQEAVNTAANQGELPDNMTSEEAKKKEGGNMTQITYINQILAPHFMSTMQRLEKERAGRAPILEEDNDDAHGTRSKNNKVQAFKERHGLKTYSNPPGSPDLSIIETVWRVLKQGVKKHKCQSIAQLKWAIEDVWESIPQGTIDGYVDSMPDRIKQVYERGGLSTEY